MENWRSRKGKEMKKYGKADGKFILKNERGEIRTKKNETICNGSKKQRTREGSKEREVGMERESKVGDRGEAIALNNETDDSSKGRTEL